MRTAATLVGLAAASSSAAAATPIVYERGELRMQDPAVVGEHVVSPLPHTYLGAEDVPAAYNPHDVDGITLVSSDLNQHIP